MAAAEKLVVRAGAAGAPQLLWLWLGGAAGVGSELLRSTDGDLAAPMLTLKLCGKAKA